MTYPFDEANIFIVLKQPKESVKNRIINNIKERIKNKKINKSNKTNKVIRVLKILILLK